MDSETSRQSLILFMAATQEGFSLDEGKAMTEEAYAYLQRKKQDSTRSYADKDKIWLLQQTLLLSSHRSDAEVLECLGLSLALSPPLNGWWFKTFMLPGDAVPIIRGERDNILPECTEIIYGNNTNPCRTLKDFHEDGERYNLRFTKTMKYIVSTQECVYEKLIEALKLIPFEWQDCYGFLAVSEDGLQVLHKELLDERKRAAIKNIKKFIKENNVFREHLRQSEDEIKYQIDDRDHGILRRVLKKIKKDFKIERVRLRPPRAMAEPSIDEVKKLLKQKWPTKTPVPSEVKNTPHATIFNIPRCFCHIHNRVHTSNSQYVSWTVKPSFISINYKCHHVDKGNKQSISLFYSRK